MESSPYAGSHVVITGAATGIGRETARMLLESGARVTALDIVPVDGDVERSIVVDLSDPHSIDHAVALIDGPVDALFNVAGVPGTHEPLHVMKVNVLGLRHLTDALQPSMPAGSAIAHVASIAGSGWERHLLEIGDLLATPDFAAGVAWCEEHRDLVADGYFFSKECVVVDTLLRAQSALAAGIRVNCVSPGPVDTPMMPAFRATVGDETLDWTIAQTMGRFATAAEVAVGLVFLNAPTSSYITGLNLAVDGGFSARMATAALEQPAT